MDKLVTFPENDQFKQGSMMVLLTRIWILLLTNINGRAYLTYQSIFHKTLNLFSSIVKSSSNPFLEPNGTRQ